MTNNYKNKNVKQHWHPRTIATATTASLPCIDWSKREAFFTWPLLNPKRTSEIKPYEVKKTCEKIKQGYGSTNLSICNVTIAKLRVAWPNIFSAPHLNDFILFATQIKPKIYPRNKKHCNSARNCWVFPQLTVIPSRVPIKCEQAELVQLKLK